ncbi:cytochrome o ubiquinol oxidase subunit IV [Methylocystis sp. H62]|uniref:cytochrome o ubiquinol oxidase subunit IV n=1 Tax=Methylocystis sp. H62 TaxID=2785789 RepID=UPI0018C34A08|nr:cytochrome o ubiquinol oxidase subunit IV [Methylocystis sp. H62]
MSEVDGRNAKDVAPGFMDAPGRSLREGLLTYATGFVLAAALTVGSFVLVRTNLIWGPGIVMALVALAIAQIGVHLVFFLHLTTAPDNTNNALALAFGVLIVTLVVGGSLWIMAHLNHNVMPGHGLAQIDLETLAADSAVRTKGVVAPVAPEPLEAQVSGVITSVQCEEGMHVEAGQVCAEIDAQPHQAEVDKKADELRATEARLERDQRKLGSARAALERKEATGARGKGVDRLRRSVERLQAQVDGDESDVQRAQSALAAAKTQVGATRIVSPIEGTIRARNVEPGHKVSEKAKTPLFVVAPDSAHVDATISAAQSGRISVGDTAVFTVDAVPGQAFSGTVTKIEPAQGGAETIVGIAAPDPNHVLRPGMMATVRIPAR